MFSFLLTFVIPITDFIRMIINCYINIDTNSWYTFCDFFNMIRNCWNGISCNFNFRFVMLFSWWSGSNCFSFAVFLFTSMEFFFNYFIMYNWLNIICNWMSVIFYFSSSVWLYLWGWYFIFFIWILIWFISYKSITLKVIFLPWLFFLLFLLFSNIRWFASFWSWTFLFCHVFFVELVHKINDLLKLNDLWV